MGAAGCSSLCSLTRFKNVSQFSNQGHVSICDGCISLCFSVSAFHFTKLPLDSEDEFSEVLSASKSLK